MADATPIIPAFNAGELSPSFDGRVDVDKYFKGAKRLENFLVTIQGPAVRRGGSRYVSAVKVEANRSWLIKFEFSASQFYALEFGDRYVRFFTSHAQVGVFGSPYEIVSPYLVGDLTNADGSCALRIVQSGDVLYIAHLNRAYPPYKLTRLADTDWVFSPYQPNQGPFLEQNLTSTTLQASGAIGAVTVTASSPVFVATDVSRLLRMDSQNIDTKPWETGKTYATDDLVRSDGKTYMALNDATSGTSPPVHEKGSAYDGQLGVRWAYQNPAYGVLRITAFNSATSVDASVIQDEDNGLNVLPAEVVSGTTTRWQLGAWSVTTEFPACVTFFRNRLWWFGKQRIWGSVPDDFENMAPDFFNEVSSDNAIVRILASNDVNDILWAVGADKLVIGTGGGEFIGGEITTSDPLGPGNFEILPQGWKRVRDVTPLAIGSSLIYVQRAGRKLMSLNYSIESDRYISSDLSMLSDHIARAGIVSLAYQSEPNSIIWAALADGSLRSLTYDLEQQVTGWARHPVGGNGAVESIVSGPAPDGSRDEIWMIVRRTINGDTHRYVEYFERPWEGPDEDGTPGDDSADAFYVDAGITYDSSPTTTITGLSHLEGATVQVLGDGARHPDQVVRSGAITLPRQVSTAQVGLQFVSRLVPMRLEAGAQMGTAQGKLKRINSVVCRFIDTLGGKLGRYQHQLDALSLRNPATPMGQAAPPASGDREITFPGDYDREGLIEIIQDGPHPMTVAALIPRATVSER